MTSKQTITGQKFFRRTSRSPWESSRNTQCNQNDQSSYNLQRNSEQSNSCRNSRITIRTQQFPVSIRTIPDQPNSGQKKLISQYYVGSAKKVTNSSLIQSTSYQSKNSQEIKFTYIPIQSMTTLQTIPAGSKKTFENSDAKGQFIKNQQQKFIHELESIKRQIENLKKHNYYLQQKLRQKTQENCLLARQNSLIKDKSTHLECQLQRISQRNNEMEIIIRQDQIINQNLRRQLMFIQQLRLKQEQNMKNLWQQTKKAEFQIRNISQLNKQLQKIIQIRQKQISQLKNLQKQNYENISYSSGQSKVLKQVRLVLKQNNKTFEKEKSSKKQTRLKQNVQRIQNKYNRFVQTDNCSLEQCLKNNQILNNLLEQKEKVIIDKNIQVNQLNFQLRNYEQLKEKVEQCQILIEELNCNRMSDLAIKLGTKYKYF